MARVMELHHGFNLCGLDNMHLTEPAEIGAECLLWSSSSVKRVFINIEKEMNEEITFKTIIKKHMGNTVEGVSFEPK
jgi:hypothetical protein